MHCYPLQLPRNTLRGSGPRSARSPVSEASPARPYLPADGPPGSLQVLFVESEGRVGELHVGVEGLLDEGPVRVALLVGALEELASEATVALGLMPELFDGAVDHALGEPDVALLQADRVVHDRLVRVPRVLGELLHRPARLFHGGHCRSPLSRLARTTSRRRSLSLRAAACQCRAGRS